MHRRNHSLDMVSGGGGSGGGGGFSYGATAPLTQKKDGQQRQQPFISSDLSRSAEFLPQPGGGLSGGGGLGGPGGVFGGEIQSQFPPTPAASIRQSPVYSRGGAQQQQRDSSVFPPTPPASVRIASPSSPRHFHNASQASLASGQSISRSSTPISLNSLFSDRGAHKDKKHKSSAPSLLSRLPFSLGGGGGGGGGARHLSVQDDVPADRSPTPSPPPVKPREDHLSDDKRRRSVNSVHSDRSVRTPTSADTGSTDETGVQRRTWLDDASSIRRSDTLATVRTDRSSVIYDQDVDLSTFGDIVEDDLSDTGTEKSITPSLFKRNRKALEGTGIATGESTMLGQSMFVDGRIMRVPNDGSTVGSMAVGFSSQPTLTKIDEPVSPLRPNSMQLPSPTESSASVPLPENRAVNTIRRTPSTGSVSHTQTTTVRRKPSPVTSSFPPANPASQSTVSLAATVASVTTIASNPSVTAVAPNPITNNSAAATSPIPNTWGGQALQTSIVELPPTHPRPDSPSTIYAMETLKKRIDEEWEDMEEDLEDGLDHPPPPYVPRLSMLPGHRGEHRAEESTSPVDEKSLLRRTATRRSMRIKRRPASGVDHMIMAEPIIAAFPVNDPKEVSNVPESSSRRTSSTGGTERPPATSVQDAGIHSSPTIEGMGGIRSIDREVVPTTPPPSKLESRRKKQKELERRESTDGAPEEDQGGTFGGRKTISKRSSPTIKSSGSHPTGVHRSTTRSKIRFSHAPEVSDRQTRTLKTSSLPIPVPAMPMASSFQPTPKECKQCQDAKDSAGLTTLYRDLLTQERSSFAIERKIWGEERKAFEKKIGELEEKLQKLRERGIVVNEDDQGQSGTFGTGKNIHMGPVVSASGGLTHQNHGQHYYDPHPAVVKGSATWANYATQMRDTGKEVACRRTPEPAANPNRTVSSPLPGPSKTTTTTITASSHSSASSSPSSSSRRPQATSAPQEPENKYWADFLDEYRLSSRCATIPTSYALVGEVETEEIDPRVRLPITEERAVYARMYAEASIGIGGPAMELLQ